MEWFQKLVEVKQWKNGLMSEKLSIHMELKVRFELFLEQTLLKIVIKWAIPLYLFRENKEPLELTIASHRIHKNFNLLTFEGYTNVNDVEPFRDGILKIRVSANGFR